MIHLISINQQLFFPRKDAALSRGRDPKEEEGVTPVTPLMSTLIPVDLDNKPPGMADR